MIYTLKESFYKHGYLLIIAAWLYTISFIFSNYYEYRSSPGRIQKQIESYLRNNEEKVAEFSADTAVLKTIINPQLKPEKALKYVNNEVGLFAYSIDDDGSLKLNFWSNNHVLPTNADLTAPDGKFFSTSGNNSYEFIKKSFYLQDRFIVIAAIIPIYTKYIIDNEYLRPIFPAVPDLSKQYFFEKKDADIYIKNGDGKALFGLKKNKEIKNKDYENWFLTFRILSVIFLLVFLNVFSAELVIKKGWVKGVSFLIATVVILRFLSYYFPFPFEVYHLPLFDPTVYASNGFHRSLGDLLINIILIFWLISFSKYAAINYLRSIKPFKGNKGWWATTLFSAILILVAFTSAGIIRSLIIDSKIPLDVSNFLSLNIYSLLSFIILCFIVLTFLHCSHIILLLVSKAVDVPAYGNYLCITLAGFLYLSFNLNNPTSASNLIVILWLLVYISILELRRDDFFVPILRSSFFVIWLIFFAASISAFIISQNRFVTLEQQKILAEKLASRADKASASLMGMGMLRIDNEFLYTNFYRFFNEAHNKAIKDSLIRENFTGYLNAFEFRLFTYSKNYNSLYNEDPVSFGFLDNIYEKRSTNTDLEYIKYNQNQKNFFNFSYLYKESVKDREGNVLGYFFIVAEAKNHKRDALTNELFKQEQTAEIDPNLFSAYAIYNNGLLEAKEGDYNFKSRVSKSEFLKQTYLVNVNKGNYELWYNGGNRFVIIVKNASIFFASITLFAYLFGSFLFVVILFQAVQFLLKLRFRLNNVKQVLNFSIRNQIHGAIIFISIFSFIVIAFATIYFYITRYNQTSRERLVKTIEVMANEIQDYMGDNKIPEDETEIDDISSRTELEKAIKEIATTHGVDVTYYDLNGFLRISSIPYLYKTRTLTNMIDPKAFYSLHYDNDIQFLHEENVSNFSYTSVYVPLNDSRGTPYAYINIPYLNTQTELKQEISNFLVTLINLNAFIFVVAGAISVFFTNRITNSFTLIENKMKEINLGKANEEIKWTTNDEIGSLVNEYNKMVKKLEESANALAKSEREGAWREMARQVAHEIKNPLTPMKLSIQYLQSAIKDKKPDVQILSEKVTATLVEQIDQLAKIASDFSQFAHLGNVIIEEFDINELIENLINLYQANQKLNIVFKRPPQPAIIRADKSQINRLFTNLFQNAIEASEGAANALILIKEEINGNKLLINVTDNGCGIPLDKQEKIFTPNFTTKSSGTGLGLAISKGIVEKANGRIWFDTEEGKGSTFHVLLPLINVPV